MKQASLTVAADTPAGIRIDKYISENAGLFSRSQIKSLLVEVRQNGKIVKPSKHAEPGARLDILYRPLEMPNFAPEKIDLAVLYEDERIIVVNKPQGLVVHPGSGVASGTLVQGLLHHVLALRESFPGEAVRPGIVHRLDKETSGVLIAAKDPDALEFLGRQFRGKSVRKVYLAIVKGRPRTSEGVVKGFIKRDPANRKRFVHADSGGKAAESAYRVLKRYKDYSLVRLEPKTGRTHQLRVHMRSLGCPVVGDSVYGRRDPRFPDAGLMLHAYRLSIKLPGEPGPRIFRAPLPQRFKDFLRAASQDET